MNTDQVNVRYMVEDVDAAIEFYTKTTWFYTWNEFFSCICGCNKRELAITSQRKKKFCRQGYA
jgi:hypothetical protein